MTNFTAEAGKTYYYEFRIVKTLIGGNSGGVILSGPSAGHQVAGDAPAVHPSSNFLTPLPKMKANTASRFSSLTTSNPKK